VGVEVYELDHVCDAFAQIIVEMQRETDLAEVDRWEVRVLDAAGIVWLHSA
jgi:hypothetical protein